MPVSHESAIRDASVSSALATVFRGKLCDTLFHGRTPLSFAKGSTLYDVGDDHRTLFFVQRGVIKVGALTDDGREVIYDLRKTGDVVGELCAFEAIRRHYAVALEQADVIDVGYEDVVNNLQRNRAALEQILEVICRALATAYDQANLLSSAGTLSRLVKVLLKLADQLGRPSGDLVEIDAYLTQEEISQMMASSREKVSIALNLLRTRSMVHYSRRGHLLLDIPALEKVRMEDAVPTGR